MDMFLLSHRLRLLPFFFIGLAAIAAGESPAPKRAPELPELPTGWQYTKKELATKPVISLYLQCTQLMESNVEYLYQRQNSPGWTAVEIAAQRKKNVELRSAAWHQLRGIKASLDAVALDSETEALGNSALEIYKANQEMDAYFLQIFGKIDSGTPLDAPEVQVLAEKIQPLIDPQKQRIERIGAEVREILTGLSWDIESGKPSLRPAPTPQTPGTITPAKKASKDELPPGMTRK